MLWIRDQAAGSRKALLIGEESARTALLLSRLGMTVHPLETRPESVSAKDAQSDPEQGSLIESERFGTGTLQSALVDASYDIAIINGAPGDHLGFLLSKLASLATVERLIVALPFGQELSRGGEALFPRQLLALLDGFGALSMEIVDGSIQAVLARGDAFEQPCDDDVLLKLTEQGSESLMRHGAEMELQLSEARNERALAEARVRDLETSTSFKLGYLLVSAVRSPMSILRLPRRVGAVLSERRRQARLAPVTSAGRKGMTDWEKESLRNRVGKSMLHGTEALKRTVAEFLPDLPPAQLAFAYLVAAQECGKRGDRDLEFEMASAALEMNHSIGMVRGFLHVALRTRRMEAASSALRELHESAARGNQIAKDFLKAFRQTSSYKIAVLESIPPRSGPWVRVEGGRLVYVLHNSLPYSSGGYATRSHGVACGLAAKGRDVVCVTRPGFPLDIKPDMAPIDMPIVDRIDGIAYLRVVNPGRRNLLEYQYVIRAMDSLEAQFRRLRPAYVQAGSNYVTALPALVAARRLGIPFIYEVRGLWEITRMSRDDKFGDSISFDVQRHIEATVAREADHVFTLTEPMREELVERGVRPENITLLPNSVDAERFQARERDDVLAAEIGIPPGVPVIGYIGTFVVYEGLEDLASACVELHNRGIDFRLLMVGNENASGQERGPIAEEILRIAGEGGIASKVIMAGRVPHDHVEAYYSLLDVCPFPRKPWPVCEMVSPMKPLEALAMKKAVVVSSVRALTEMIQHEGTGMVFEKGNVGSLTDVIADLIDKPEKRRLLGEAGREWVSRERSWLQVADRIEQILAGFEAVTVEAPQAEGSDIATGLPDPASVAAGSADPSDVRRD